MDKQHFFRRAKRALTDPMHDYYLFLVRTSKWWSDESFVKRMYWARTGQHLNLDNPTTFTEKQNWLKLHDHNPLYTLLADKYRVKEYVKDQIGEEYVVPCLGCWERVDDIDFDLLPSQFVLKCNHNSGGAVICKDKRSLKVESAKERLQRSYNDDFFKYSRVWPYKNIKRCILADKYLDDHMGTELRDYKWWCFNGEPRVMYITNKSKDIFENFYDMEFNALDITHGYRRITPEITKPAEFELMKQLAAKLSSGIPFVRVDFFDIEGHVYFGEFTFYDWGGMKPLSDKWEKKLGELIELPKR